MNTTTNKTRTIMNGFNKQQTIFLTPRAAYKQLFGFALLGLFKSTLATAQLTSVYQLSAPENIYVNSPYAVKVTNTQNTAFFGEVIGANSVLIQPGSSGGILISPIIIDGNTPNLPPPSVLTGGTGSLIRTSTGTGAKISITQFPNPTTKLINVTLSNGSAIGYQLYDSMGILIQEAAFTCPQNNYTINVETLQPGIYLQKINFGYNAYLTVQFIKQ